MGVGALALGLSLHAGTAAAQDSDFGPITVRPSGFVVEPTSAEALLARRLARSDYAFRAICRGCGRDGQEVEVGRSFSPIDVLKGSSASR